MHDGHDGHDHDVLDLHDERLVLDVVRTTKRAFDAAEKRPVSSDEPARHVLDALITGVVAAGAGAGGGRTAAHDSDHRTQLRVVDHLEAALATARRSGGSVADVAEALCDVAPRLAWERRPGSENESAAFADGHANAVLARTPDEFGREVLLGISLVAPHVRYPDHQHPPEEVYVVLSPGRWRNADERWHEPGPGGVVHNPAGIVHAMRADDAPLLALWLHRLPPRSDREARRDHR